MNISQRGIDFIARHEGRRLAVYLDPVKKPTVGIGHLLTAAERKKWPVGTKFTSAEVDAIFRKDISRFEAKVRKVKVPLNQNQFDALVSFAFNLGSLLGVGARLDAGNYQGAADAMLLYNKASGKVLAGLTRRRKEERALFLKPVTSPLPPRTDDQAQADLMTDLKLLYAAAALYDSEREFTTGPKPEAVAAFNRIRRLPGMPPL